MVSKRTTWSRVKEHLENRLVRGIKDGRVGKDLYCKISGLVTIISWVGTNCWERVDSVGLWLIIEELSVGVRRV